jgi:hypothetical protein
MARFFICLLTLLFSLSSPASEGNVEIWHSTLAARSEMQTVVHFTDQAGVNLIQNSGALRAGTYVTLPSEVGGLNAAGVEAALEIQAGRGAFSTTIQVPRANLAIPANGPLTSGQRIQFQHTQPATPAPFVPTPPH